MSRLRETGRALEQRVSPRVAFYRGENHAAKGRTISESERFLAQFVRPQVIVTSEQAVDLARRPSRVVVSLLLPSRNDGKYCAHLQSHSRQV